MLLVCSADPFCQEAFAALVDNHMLTNNEELALLDSLPFSPQDRWLALLYRAKCKKARHRRQQGGLALLQWHMHMHEAMALG